MAKRELSIIAGALSRASKPRLSPRQDELARRWRNGPLVRIPPLETPGIIPLIDGWIRLLEREACKHTASTDPPVSRLPSAPDLPSAP